LTTQLSERGLAGWAAEVTRQDFLLGSGGVIGHAIVHSKVIVIDPFTNPVVITGSHNFSQSASAKNDENLVIVRGNRALAERYAVNIMATYQHYRWRAYLKDCANKAISPWQGLMRDDSWQKRNLAMDPELRFWLQPVKA
jgi:phosphatidylserine/phosphatidylglycerophosphate/cardiolipin synthase-like enzyme